MDLEHIEVLAQDKYLTEGAIVASFLDYDVDAFEWYEEDGEIKPSYYTELTDEQKIKLITKAKHYWYSTEVDTSLGIICDCVMKWQHDILNGTMSEVEFFKKLSYMI